MPSDLEITDMIREIVPTDGTPTSNHNVMRQLIARLGRQVERDEYFALRQRLVDRGELIPVYGGYGCALRGAVLSNQSPLKSKRATIGVKNAIYTGLSRIIFLSFGHNNRPFCWVRGSWFRSLVMHDQQMIVHGPFPTLLP